MSNEKTIKTLQKLMADLEAERDIPANGRMKLAELDKVSAAALGAIRWLRKRDIEMDEYLAGLAANKAKRDRREAEAICMADDSASKRKQKGYYEEGHEDGAHYSDDARKSALDRMGGAGLTF